MRFNAKSDSQVEVSQVTVARNALFQNVDQRRIARLTDLSVAEYRSEDSMFLVRKPKGKALTKFGIRINEMDGILLSCEEAMFLMDSSLLEPKWNNRLLSIQEMMRILIKTVSWNHYLVFAHLCREGYTVVKHGRNEMYRPKFDILLIKKQKMESSAASAYAMSSIESCSTDADDILSKLQIIKPFGGKPRFKVAPAAGPSHTAPLEGSTSESTSCDPTASSSEDLRRSALDSVPDLKYGSRTMVELDPRFCPPGICDAKKVVEFDNFFLKAMDSHAPQSAKERKNREFYRSGYIHPLDGNLKGSKNWSAFKKMKNSFYWSSEDEIVSVEVPGLRSLKVTYDVFMPGNVNLKEPPDFRLIVMDPSSRPPTYDELFKVKQKLNDNILIRFACVDNGEISFYYFDCIRIGRGFH